MNEQLLPLAVWVQMTFGSLRARAVDTWTHRHDEDGVDEAVTKMIWLAVGIVLYAVYGWRHSRLRRGLPPHDFTDVGSAH